MAADDTVADGAALPTSRPWPRSPPSTASPSGRCAAGSRRAGPPQTCPAGQTVAPPRPSFDADKIVALYVEGRTQRQVAASLGYSVSPVARRLQAAGVRRRADPERLAGITRRYQAGELLAEIAAALGMSTSGAWHAMASHGLERRLWGTHRGAATG